MVAVATTLIATATAIPANPAYADGIRDQQWYLQSLHVSQTRSITTGAGVTVAVVDTGTYPHPDIRKNLLKGIDETAGGTGDGQTDQVGHGTGMASLIAGHGRTGDRGVEGIAPSAKIMPVRISKSRGGISGKAMANGVSWATSHGAKVINVSAAAGPAFELEDAVAAAIKADVVVVAAAGNSSTDVIISYPAAIDGVVAVGATGRDGKHASISVKDAKIQICAPGVDITTAQPKNKYSIASGTSDATAIVSGAAALVRAKFPQLSAKDVINRLTATADDIGPPGRDNECGFGRLNIVKALTADVPPLEASSSPSSSVTPPPTAPSTPLADPKPASNDSSSTPLLLGALAGLVVAGGVIAALVIRRRRGF